MSTDANKALLHRVMEAIKAGQLDELADHPGFWETRQVIPLAQTMFSDWRMITNQQIAEHDLVFSYGALYVTHGGQFAGVAATDRRVRLEVMSMDQVTNGIVVQHNSASTWFDVMREVRATGFDRWPRRGEPLMQPFAPRGSGSPSANKAVVATLLQALSHGDERAAEQHDGIGSLIDEFRAIRSAFPDLRCTPVAQIAEGELVGTRATITGTHTEPLHGLKPTGKPISFDFYSLDQIANGAVVAHRSIADWNAALEQLGVLTSFTDRPNVG